MLRTNGRWWDWMNRKYAAEDNLTMQPMNGVFYLRRGAAFNWTATAP
jgi:hypothetical protein